MVLVTKQNTFTGKWREIVSKWGGLNAEYLERVEDFPAWYVENSNSALFAAAAWQCGVPAICEVDIEKRRYLGHPGRPRTASGRFDIELHMGGSGYVIEAKRRHFSISSASNYSLRHSFLAASVAAVCDDCWECRAAAERCEMSLAALVFFSGSIDEDAPERSQAQGFRSALSDLLDAEFSAFDYNMNELNVSLNRRRGKKLLGWALFQNDPTAFDRPAWRDCSWPAVCGVIGVSFT